MHVYAFFQGSGFFSLVRNAVYNSAKFTIGFGLFLREKRGASRFILGNKGGVGGDSIEHVFHFFCDHYRRFSRGDGGGLARSGLLWFVGELQVLMIAIEKLITGLRES